MKKCWEKIISTVLIICVMLSVTAVTVFADSTRVVDLTKEELSERLWESVESGTVRRIEMNDDLQNSNAFKSFLLSIRHDELYKFLQSYEAKVGTSSYDDTVSDVAQKFYKYYGSIYSGEVDIEIKDDNTIVMSNYDSENTDKKIYWTYDSATDKYIGKDENGTIINSYNRYPVEEITTEQTPTETQISEQNNIENQETERTTSAPKTNIAYDDGSGNITAESNSDTNTVSPQNSNSDGMVSASPSTTTETENTANGSTNIILIIIGILIVIGLGIIAFMLKKRKDEN